MFFQRGSHILEAIGTYLATLSIITCHMTSWLRNSFDFTAFVKAPRKFDHCLRLCKRRFRRFVERTKRKKSCKPSYQFRERTLINSRIFWKTSFLQLFLPSFIPQKKLRSVVHFLGVIHFNKIKKESSEGWRNILLAVCKESTRPCVLRLKNEKSWDVLSVSG